jgi:hypothetical protein
MPDRPRSLHSEKSGMNLLTLYECRRHEVCFPGCDNRSVLWRSRKRPTWQLIDECKSIAVCVHNHRRITSHAGCTGEIKPCKTEPFSFVDGSRVSSDLKSPPSNRLEIATTFAPDPIFRNSVFTGVHTDGDSSEIAFSPLFVSTQGVRVIQSS